MARTPSGAVRYASTDYQQALAARGIQCSMSRKGTCWDNAVVERLFSSLKLELVYNTDFATHERNRGKPTARAESCTSNSSCSRATSCDT